MTKIPEGLISVAQEVLSRARHIGATYDVGHQQISIMPEDALNELVNDRLARLLSPYLTEMAGRGEAIVKVREFSEPGALATTFRADVVAMSVDDYSHLCSLLRRMRQLNAEPAP